MAINAKLATIPYAATPVFPSNITRLNIISAIADAISPIKEEKPSKKIFFIFEKLILHLQIWNPFFLLMKCIERIQRLITGEIPVAKAAPKIPIDIGNIKT